MIAARVLHEALISDLTRAEAEMEVQENKWKEEEREREERKKQKEAGRKLPAKLASRFGAMLGRSVHGG